VSGRNPRRPHAARAGADDEQIGVMRCSHHNS
jgi:hypothetical protein